MTIHIRDVILKKAYKVDHLPPGLVLPASIISGLGFTITQNFEQIFSHSDPEYLPYHKYGTLFGAQLMSEVRNFKIQDPKFAEMQHTLVIGSTGTGKTALIADLVEQIRKRGERLIIYDLK